ncbi:MAG: substrate-binding domain-containing protein [Clostridia bacterium]
MKKTLSIVLILALLMLGATAFAQENKDITIAIVSQNQGNPVFFDLEVGARETAEKLGINFKWYAPETGDSVKEAELIEAAANAGAQGIGVVPLDNTLATTMEAMTQRGIYMSIINSDTISYPGMAFANGTPQFDGGYSCGKLALQYLTDPEKTYTIAMIEGQAGTEAFTLRMEGFEQCLIDNGVKYEILAKLPCDDDFNKAVEQVETFTIANPDLDMWYFAGGWPLMVEVNSLPEFAKWHAVEGHKCISFDAFPPMKAFFDAGLCDGCCGQYYYKMGEMTVTYLYNLIKGETLPKPEKELGESKTPWYSTGTLVIEPAQYQQIFSEMAPW